MIAFGGSSRIESRRETIGQLRRTQLVTTFGPGSLIDLPGYSVVIGAVDQWDQSRLRPIHDSNLEHLLGVSEFREPRGSEDLYKSPGIVRAHRFPYMHYCPQCHRLGEYWKLAGKDGRKCSRCNTELVPSRFITVCPNGHLEDFPYNWWVHYGHWEKGHELAIHYSNATGELSGIEIECRTCKKKRTMKGSTSMDALASFTCQGHRPWVGPKREDNDPNPCGGRVRAVARGASNAYYPNNVSALTIPRALSTVIGDKWDTIATLILSSDVTEETRLGILNAVMGEDLSREGYTIEQAMEEIKRRESLPEHINSKQALYENEYLALIGPEKDMPYLKTERVPVPDEFNDRISDVVRVRRLREILVQKSFSRVYPSTEAEDSKSLSMPLGKEGLNWLPAVELLGEGIFIRFDEERLAEWEIECGSYYERMAAALASSSVNCPNFSPRYVMLHTFAHILIRQLSVDCGYSGASLKERVYSTYPESDQNMSGVLIYTSSSDSDGSLGGLVRQGLPSVLGSTLERALDSAGWCSSDPVCGEAVSQGVDGLNRAACHACALLPETSCEMRNSLLDRKALVGKRADGDMLDGFFVR